MTKPEDSDFLRGDGPVVSETAKSLDFTGRRGERSEAFRPGTSDIWKVGAEKVFVLCLSLE